MWVLVDAEIYLSLRRLPSDHTIAHAPAAGTGSAGWKSARTWTKLYADWVAIASKKGRGQWYIR